MAKMMTTTTVVVLKFHSVQGKNPQQNSTGLPSNWFPERFNKMKLGLCFLTD